MAPTSIRFEAVEFMDGMPLAGATIQARAVVIVTTKIDLPVFDPDSNAPRGAAGGGGGPSARGGAGGPTVGIVASGPRTMARRANEMVEVPDGLVCEIKTLTTDASGSAMAAWDPATDTLFKTNIDALRSKHGVDPLVHFDVGLGLGTNPVGLFRLTQPLPLGGDRRQRFTVDLAATIVGHVTQTTARLWFAPAGDLSANLTASLILTQRGVPIRGRRPTPVTFSSGVHKTATVDLANLRPGTDYEYQLSFTSPAGGAWPAGRGWFRTAEPTTKKLRIAFGSCHDPKGPHDTDRWVALDRWMPDFTLLMGDQVYGDTKMYLPTPTELLAGKRPGFVEPPGGWSAFYERRYRSSWAHRPVRQALRSRPTYMMLDDHDVADDWGVTFTSSSGDGHERVKPALEAYVAYQHAHNPATPGQKAPGDALDYPIERGEVVLYVLDERTRRRLDPAHPILGTKQFDRFQAWATSPAVQAADIVVVVSPVPFALCNIELAADLLKALDRTRDIVGTATWPLSAVTEAVTGWGINDLGPDVQIVDGRIVEPDLADQWSDSRTQGELRGVLDILFDLQNDPAHRRIVVVLSGDAHAAAVHSIWSTVPRHADNNVIYQLTSSPIGRAPASDLADMINQSDALLGGFPLVASGPVPIYFGSIEGMWGQRNFGSLVVMKRPRRVYELHGALHLSHNQTMDSDEVRLDIEIDLSRPGRPVTNQSRPIPRFIADRL